MRQDLLRGVTRRRLLGTAMAVLLATSLTACRQDMHDQPRYEPLEASNFFHDGMSERPLIEDTVARGHLDANTALYTGKDSAGQLLTQLPVHVDEKVIRRGQERFNIYCSPCHGKLGDGLGMVARRGFKQPPTFHQARLRNQPVGYFFDVMTNGFGVMPSYASQIPVADRWAIVAYLRVLQFSQGAHLAELPQQDQEAVAKLDQGTAPADAAPAPTTAEH